MFKIILVEDEIRTREGLKSLIQKFTPDFEVIAEATNGLEGYKLIQKLNPDVVISDIKMPFYSGLEMIQKLRNEGCKTKFILLTGYADFSYARQAITLQIEDYLLKPIIVHDLIQLLDKIKVVFSKNTQLAPPLETRIINYINGTSQESTFRNSFISDAHLLTQCFEVAFIYIPISALQKNPNIYLNIKSISTNHHPSTIVIELSSHFVLLLNNQLNPSKLLTILHKYVHPHLGMMEQRVDSLIELVDVYQKMYSKRYYFLSCGIDLVLSITKEQIFNPIDSYYTSALINKFYTAIYKKSYKDCPLLIQQLCAVLENHNFFPEDIQFTFSSLFNSLVRHINDLFKKENSFPYN